VEHHTGETAMSFLPSDSAIKVTKSIEEQLQGVTNVEQIKQIMRDASLAQNLVRKDFDPAYLIPVENTAAPTKVSKVVTLNGVAHSLIADDEAGLLRQESDLYRQAMQPAATTQQTEQPRNERGQFTATEQVTDEQKALQLQFQLGQIDIETYLDKSGAIEKHIERRETETRTSGWESATQDFLNSAEGASWPGGNEALTRIGQIIEASGLVDTNDKLEALKQAYAAMQQEDDEITAQHQDAETQTRVAGANSVEEIRHALGRSSSMFGR
jgi:hypothetical protein